MLRSFLIGLVAGQRGITPLAAVAVATRAGEVSADLPLQELFFDDRITAATFALAAAELAGDKMKSAPDRTVPIGLIVRGVTSAYAGAAFAPRRQRAAGALLGAGTALASSYLGLRLRKTAMRQCGQTVSGLAEDAVVVGSALAIADPQRFGLHSGR